MGIPRGGIEVGYYAAQHLKCDFDAIVVRKLGYPFQPEAAFGALAEDGSLYLDPWSNKYLTKELIETVVSKEEKEIKRRIETYRNGEELPDLTDRIVILVDDGIATGATVFAAIEACRKEEPQWLVVAAPVASTHIASKLERKTDEIIILEQRRKFFAVSEAYEEFTNLSDKEVVYFMDLGQTKANSHNI